MNIKEIMNVFITDFNYVDDNGKRNGFLLFSNNLLTQNLEILAIGLKRQISTLADDNELNDTAKFESLIQLITDCVKAAQKARITHAPLETCHEYYPPHFGSREGTMIHYTYKNPYQPSKFEMEIINGLEAIVTLADKPHFMSHANYLKSNCNHLINTIKAYEPEKVIINDFSYIP